MDNKLNIMKEQFVSSDIAVQLKELGFDEECLAYWDHTYKTFNLQWCRYNMHSATKLPLWQQAIDWCMQKLRTTEYCELELKYFYDYSGVMCIGDKEICDFNDREMLVDVLIRFINEKFKK